MIQRDGSMSIYAVIVVHSIDLEAPINILKLIRQLDFSSHQVVGTSLGGMCLGNALFHNMPVALLTGLFGFGLVQHQHFK